MSKKITLKNDFHETEANVIPAEWNGKLQLTPEQVRRAWKKLCGIKTCQCSDDIGQRDRNRKYNIIYNPVSKAYEMEEV